MNAHGGWSASFAAFIDQKDESSHRVYMPTEDGLQAKGEVEYLSSRDEKS